MIEHDTAMPKLLNPTAAQKLSLEPARVQFRGMNPLLARLYPMGL
jgi:hypothetical protein